MMVFLVTFLLYDGIKTIYIHIANILRILNFDLSPG